MAVETPKYKRWTADLIASQKGRRVLITGANSGIGYETALELARHGAEIILPARSLTKSNPAISRIRRLSKTIFITGATSGFGLATAKLFTERGWKVAATYKRLEVSEALSTIPGISVYALDVADEAEVSRVVEQVISEVGLPDVVVKNAGYSLIGSLEGSTMEQIRRQFDVNVFGLIAVTKASLPHLRERGSGTIFNFSSSSALANYPFVPVYGASKSAVRGLSEALFIELAPFGIKVKTIFPGLHSTKIFTKLDPAVGPGSEAYAPYFKNFAEIQSKSEKAGDPDQVAQTIWQAVQKNDDKRDYPVNRDATLLIKMKRFLSDAAWKKMNVGMIVKKPAEASADLSKPINSRFNSDFVPLLHRNEPSGVSESDRIRIANAVIKRRLVMTSRLLGSNGW